VVRAKQDELSEASIRKELAEKKLSNATKDSDMTIEKLAVCYDVELFAGFTLLHYLLVRLFKVGIIISEKAGRCAVHVAAQRT